MFSVLLYCTISAFYFAIMAIDNLLDDADLDIVDDEMDMERKNRTDGSSCCSISYECEE